LYVFWAYIGKLVTGKYAYFFFNLQMVGWESLIIAVISLIGLVNTCEVSVSAFTDRFANFAVFAFNYGLTGLREILTKHSEDKNVGYTRLPQ
jgi:hypothetical protein